MVVSTDGMNPGHHRKIITPFDGAATYTVAESDLGHIISTRSATQANTLTLPSAKAHPGAELFILSIAAQNLTVKTNAASEMVVTKDATASQAALGALASHRIGAMFWCICDGTSWFVAPIIESASATSADIIVTKA